MRRSYQDGMLGVNRSSHLSAAGDTNPLNQEFGFKLLVKNQRHSDFLSRATSLPRSAASFGTESRYMRTEKSVLNINLFIAKNAQRERNIRFPK